MKSHSDIQADLAVYDSLSVAEQAELDRHLRECRTCAEQLAAYRRMDQKLARLHDPWLGPQVAQAVEAMFSGQAMSATRPQPVPLQKEHATRVPSLGFARLLLPIGMILVFALSLWLGMRYSEPIDIRSATTPTVALPAPTATPPTEDASGHITITFACSGTEYGINYRKIADAFEHENPDITINVIRMEAIQPTNWGSSAGIGVELVPENNFKLAAATDAFCRLWPQDIWGGAVRDLSPFIAADSSFNLDDFYPGMLKHWTLNEKIYALPTFFRPKMIYYNPAAFDAAGVSYPRLGWTWDELLETATRLTQRTGETTTRWGLGDTSFDLFQARAGTALNPTMNSRNLNDVLPTNTPELLRWFNELYVVRRVAPIPETFRTGEFTPGDWPAFMADVIAGRYAMWVDDAYPYARRGGQPVPFPVVSPDDKTTPIGAVSADVLALSAYSRHPDATWRWLSYLSRHLASPRYDMLPVRRSLMEQEAFWTGLTPAAADAYRYAFEHLAPNTMYYISLDHKFTKMVRALVAGETDLPTLLTELVDLKASQPDQTEIAAATGRFIWPATGLVTQRYAPEHPGIVITGASGEPVKAADGGTVIVAQNDAVSGNTIVIDHSYGFHTMYAHLNRIAVQVGQQVAQGELLGEMGTTSDVTEPTLYFAIYGNSGPLDPLQYLR